eukprot:5746346-Prymnesium_polylepis.1
MRSNCRQTAGVGTGPVSPTARSAQVRVRARPPTTRGAQPTTTGMLQCRRIHGRGRTTTSEHR